MPKKNKPEVKLQLDELCEAVKRTRLAYGDTQERFARRVALSVMTISRFELGKAVPKDPNTLDRLVQVAASHGSLDHEAGLFAEAANDARRRLSPYDRFTPFADQAMPFQSLREWRLMGAARIAARYYQDEAARMAEAAPEAMEIVDSILADANPSEDIDAGFYLNLEQKLTELAEQRALKRIQQLRKETRKK
jgi:transcriptional regulator with XRE-family HTH domain